MITTCTYIAYTLFITIHIYILESSAALRAALIHSRHCLKTCIGVATAPRQTNSLQNFTQALKTHTQTWLLKLCSRHQPHALEYRASRGLDSLQTLSEDMACFATSSARPFQALSSRSSPQGPKMNTLMGLQGNDFYHMWCQHLDLIALDTKTTHMTTLPLWSLTLRPGTVA